MADQGVFRHLDTVGDGSGTRAMAIDYSSLDGLYYVKPPESQVYVIEQMIITVEFDGSIRADYYGDINGGLATGIEIKVLRGLDVILDLTNGTPIKTNADWRRLCFEVEEAPGQPGPSILTANWHFSSSGKPLFLNGKLHDALFIAIHDDLSSLNEQSMFLNGHSKPS
ncbi:MAG: hypothetical protein GY906_13060 [bacterium]|nr:hypothetical protein [bacterium]